MLKIAEYNTITGEKIDFKNLDKEQMVIAFNQLKDDYHTLFERKEQLEEVIDEIREFINKDCDFNGTSFFDKFVSGKKVLQILDKVKGE